MERSVYDALISALGKRVFLMRNVHDREPTLFQTRWAMNYLAGPLTRVQIPLANTLVGAQPATSVRQEPVQARMPSADSGGTVASTMASAADTTLQLPGSITPPSVPRGVGDYLLPVSMTLRQAASTDRRITLDGEHHGILYRPHLLAQLDVRFSNRKYGLDSSAMHTALVEDPGDRGRVRWEDYVVGAISERDMERLPEKGARFASLDTPLNDGKVLRSLQADVQDWAYREITAAVKANETLKVYAGPELSQTEFRRRCQAAADKLEEAEIEKVKARFQRQIERFEKRLRDEERELKEDEAELGARKREELTKHAETVIGFIMGRRRSVSSSLTKRRMTERAKADVEESEAAITQFKQELEELAEEQRAAVEEIQQKWDEVVADISEIQVSPYKKDITVSMFGVAWFPYYLVPDGDRLLELPAFAVPMPD
jgi:predicted  nucleic acid-binding Zn-ribbon protein